MIPSLKTAAANLLRVALGRPLLRFAPCALASVLLQGCVQPLPTSEGTPARDGFSPPQFARALFSETNRVRAIHGLPPLAPDPALDAAAGEQVAYLSFAMQSGHSNPFPGEHTVEERVSRQGRWGSLVGENTIMLPLPAGSSGPVAGWGYGDYARRVVDGWMNSPGHRANILNRRFTNLGCWGGLARGIRPGDERIFAAQVFLVPTAHGPDGSSGL